MNPHSRNGQRILSPSCLPFHHPGGKQKNINPYTEKSGISRFFNLRAENGTRTRDPNLGKVVLYQLSYFRKFLWNLRDFCYVRYKNFLKKTNFICFKLFNQIVKLKWTLFDILIKNFEIFSTLTYRKNSAWGKPSFANAKLLLFFDMTKYFCDFFCIFFIKVIFRGLYQL